MKAILLVALLSFSIFSEAQEDLASLLSSIQAREGPRCIPLHSIERTSPLSENHIIFRTKDDKLYINFLTRACPGLDKRDALQYRDQHALCRNDEMRIREIGIGDGFTCRLGDFKEVTEDELLEVNQRLEALLKAT